MSKITVFSIVFLLMAGAAALYIIMNREAPVPLVFEVERASEISLLPDGAIQNNYKIIIPNDTSSSQKYILRLHKFSKGKMEMKGAWKDIAVKDFYVAAGSIGTWNIFVIGPRQRKTPKKISFRLQEVDTKRRGKYDSVFISKKVEDERVDKSKK